MAENPDAPKVGNLRGTARPAAHLRAAFRLLHGRGAEIPLDQALDEALQIESLAKILVEGLKVAASDGDGDGYLDLHLLAAHIIKKLKEE